MHKWKQENLNLLIFHLDTDGSNHPPLQIPKYFSERECEYKIADSHF
jgi:hypothetical protein